MTAEEVLAGAADLLEQKGWVQNCWEDEKGRCCLLGAIAHIIKSAEGTPLIHWATVKRAVQQEIGLPPGDVFGEDLISWNNQRGRRKEEVISALRNSKRWLP